MKRFEHCIFVAAMVMALLLTGCSRPEPTAPRQETAVVETAQSEPELAVPETAPERQTTETLPQVQQELRQERSEYEDVLVPQVAADSRDSSDSVVPDNKRGRYDSGTCYQLEGDIFAVAIFLDDDVSGWPEEKVLTYLDQLVKPGLKFIEDNAALWDVSLKIDVGYYATYGHPDRPVKYSGVIDPHNGTDYTRDILEQASVAIGFESKEDMHRRLQDYSGSDQIIYIVMLNKGGRSYSFSFNHADNTTGENRINAMEYAMIYTGFTDDSGDTASDTIAHETLHMFGARDYYMPQGRTALARSLYPKDIMLCDMPDLEFFDLGEVTAYSVGWTDEIPEVLFNEDWWREGN